MDTVVDSALRKSLQRLVFATSKSELPSYVKDAVESDTERLLKELDRPERSVDRSNAIGYLSDRIRMSLRSDASLRNLAGRTFDDAGIGGSPWRYLPLALACAFLWAWYVSDFIYLRYEPEVLLPALIGWLALRFGVRMLPVLIALGWFAVLSVACYLDVFSAGIGIGAPTYLICWFVALSLAGQPVSDKLCHQRWRALRWAMLGLVCAGVVLRESDFADGTVYANMPIILAILLLAFALDWVVVIRGLRQITQYREWKHARWLVGAGAVALILALTGSVRVDELDDEGLLYLCAGVGALAFLFIGIILFSMRRVAAPWLFVSLAIMAFFPVVEEGYAEVYVSAGLEPSFWLLFGLVAGLSVIGHWRLSVGVLAVTIIGTLAMEWWGEALRGAAEIDTGSVETPFGDLEEIVVLRSFDWLAAGVTGLGAIAAGAFTGGFLRNPYQATSVEARNCLQIALLALYVCVVVPRFGGAYSGYVPLLNAAVAFMAGRLWGVRAIVAAPIVFPILTLVGPDNLNVERLAWSMADAAQLAIVYLLWAIFGMLSNRLSPPVRRNAT